MSSETSAVPEKMGIHADELREIATWDDAAALAQQYGMPLVNAADEIGDGFALQNDKNILVGVPFLALTWTFSKGEYGDESEFVTVRCVTKSGEKWIINDGSTGLKDQLKSYSDRTGVFGGLMVLGGLRRSDYEKEVVNQKTGELETTPAKTFYLNV